MELGCEPVRGLAVQEVLWDRLTQLLLVPGEEVEAVNKVV
jgi:hypothetical protein